VRNTSNGPRSLGPYPVDGCRRVRSEDEWDSPVYTCCVVGSAISNGVGVRTRWIMEGACQLSEVVACLQLATVAIASAEAMGMEGDLDDLMSSEEDSMDQGEEGPSQDQ